MDKREQKANKTKFGIAIIGLVILALLTAFGIFFSKSVNIEKYEGDIVSFSFHHGSYFGGYVDYDIWKDGEKVIFKAKGYNMSSDIDFEKTISPKYLSDLEDIIVQNNVASWDGFNKSDNDVMDGHSFSLKVTYENGESIEAHGYMKYPKNYNKVEEEFSRVLEGIK